ncbi:hypothetical protein [Flavobacterium daejeonense]|uniref:hypothetical protein n=1 Tax=Flavobacterium daejeonense TaxID=350893 RepID=UPI00047ADEAB|nr:hypothetical protein [Flavobacterium daejeonense]
MEPNKLEKQFREQLNSREIKPSEIAWEKLDAMLLEAEKPEAKFPWLYVAASFVGVSLFCTVFLNVENLKVHKENPIVVKPKIEVDILKEEKNINEIVLPIKANKAVVQSKLKEQSEKTMNLDAKVIIKEKADNEVSVVLSEKENYQSTVKNRYVSAEKLLAEISNTKFESTDETIKNTTKTVSVNPQLLLSNAENELNQSFKESALDRFNKKFKTIKTVLANRNYEE